MPVKAAQRGEEPTVTQTRTPTTTPAPTPADTATPTPTPAPVVARNVTDTPTFEAASMPVMQHPDRLFSLKVKVGLGSVVVIHAFDGGRMRPNHNRIDVEVRHNGEVIFPKGGALLREGGLHRRQGGEGACAEPRRHEAR